MSTEHQQYSTENQADKIREYAARRNIQIVRTYADEGKSGHLAPHLALQPSDDGALAFDGLAHALEPTSHAAMGQSGHQCMEIPREDRTGVHG